MFQPTKARKIASTSTAARRAFSGHITKIVKQSRDGLGVVQLSAPDHGIQFRQRVWLDLDFFVLFRLGFACRQALSDQQIHAFLEKAGSREEVKEDAKAFRAITGFLHQFASSGGPDGLAVIYAARNQLPQILSRGMTV